MDCLEEERRAERYCSHYPGQPCVDRLLQIGRKGRQTMSHDTSVLHISSRHVRDCRVRRPVYIRRNTAPVDLFVIETGASDYCVLSAGQVQIKWFLDSSDFYANAVAVRYERRSSGSADQEGFRDSPTINTRCSPERYAPSYRSESGQRV